MGSAVCKEVWRPTDPKSMHNLWAPEIHRINDKWYIYYAADDGNTDNHQIYVLENDARTPMEGTFKQKGPIMTNQEWNWGIHALLLCIKVCSILFGQDGLSDALWKKPNVFTLQK